MIRDDLIASTQYGDLVGTSSIDGHGSAELLSLARDNGIDVAEWFPIGISLSHMEGFDCVCIYCVDGVSTHDELEAFIRASPGSLPVTSFQLKDYSVADYLKDIKRFSVIAKIQAVRNVAEFEVSEAE